MYEGRTKSPPPLSAGLDVAFLHNTRLSPKTTISLMIVMRMRDETHCSAALSCAVLLMIPQPRGRCQGVNFWTEPFADSSYRKSISEHASGEFFFLFFLCILGVFLFARFISFPSLPESDPPKYARLSLSPGPRELRVFSSWNCERPQLSISNAEPISHIWHGFFFSFCEPECVRCWKASTGISKTILRQN